MFIAMFIVPLIYLLNAFFIGRLIKRAKAGSDGFLNYVLGFLGVFVILYFANIILYTTNAQVWGYALTYGIFQILLLAAYIFNWRYLIFKPRICVKKIIIFFAVTIVVVGICFLSFRDSQSMFGVLWSKTISDITPSLGNVISFDKNLIINFSVLNISNIFWANIFHVSTAEQIYKFVNVSWTIMAGIICGATATWIIDEINSKGKIVLISLTFLILIVITLAFIESFAIPDAWLLIEVFIYILALISKKNRGTLKLLILMLVLMSMVATTSNAYFLVCALFIFSVYWAVRNNANSISYFFCLGWIVLNVISGFISAEARYFLLSANTVYTVFMIILFLVYRKIGTPKWEVKMARGASKQSTKIVYIFLALFIALILIANLFIFYEKYNFEIKKIDYKNFLTFIYRIIWNIRIDNDVSIAIINAILYALFVSLIIAFLVLRKSKKSKGYWFTKDVPVKLGVVAAILFCNPLSVHIFNVATGDYSMNTSNMNIMLVVPFIIFAMQAITNYNKYTFEKWNYYWI